MNLDVPGMQKKLHISKPAISYILNTLEKKNYITREIDPKDRRKVSISATPEGKAAARQSQEKYDAVWEDTAAMLQRRGEGKDLEIRVGENESLESALKRFKRKCARSGVLAEVRRREHYEKPSVKRKKKAEAARLKLVQLPA